MGHLNDWRVFALERCDRWGAVLSMFAAASVPVLGEAGAQAFEMPGFLLGAGAGLVLLALASVAYGYASVPARAHPMPFAVLGAVFSLLLSLYRYTSGTSSMDIFWNSSAGCMSVVLLLGLIAAVAQGGGAMGRLRAMPPARPGACPWCGYDIRGLPFPGDCPECGASILNRPPQKPPR